MAPTPEHGEDPADAVLRELTEETGYTGRAPPHRPGRRRPLDGGPPRRVNVAAPWMFDELAHAGPEHLDAGFVAGYDRKQGFPDPAEDVAVLLGHGLGPAGTLVDLGAGTGRLALAAAAHVGRVVAVDVSPLMQRLLRDRVVEAGLANVECVQAGFLSYRHSGPPADAVYTRNALHHLPDFWKAVALHRVARLLRPGGVLRLHELVFDFGPAEADDVIGRWLDGAAEDPSHGYTRADLVEHLRSEFSTFRWLLEPMLAAAGFEIVTAEYRGRVYGAYTCVRTSSRNSPRATTTAEPPTSTRSTRSADPSAQAWRIEGRPISAPCLISMR